MQSLLEASYVKDKALIQKNYQLNAKIRELEKIQTKNAVAQKEIESLKLAQK